MQVQEWLIERQQLLERIKELEAENAKLRKKLGEDVTSIEKKPTAMQNLSLQEKVDLFRSLFKGRELRIYGITDIRRLARLDKRASLNTNDHEFSI